MGANDWANPLTFVNLSPIKRLCLDIKIPVKSPVKLIIFTTPGRSKALSRWLNTLTENLIVQSGRLEYYIVNVKWIGYLSF
jgi:hypothetical protein